MRRRHEADVDGSLLGLTDAADGARLQRAKKLRLKRRRQLSDLVEEDRAARRRFEVADARGDRAGERAPHVAEELGLEEVLGDGRAVDHDERAFLPRAPLVDGARDSSFPVPVSPWTSTDDSVGATRAMRAKRRRMLALPPTSAPKWSSPHSSSGSFEGS